jgi:hypothetical protein
MAFTLKINGTPHEVDVDGDTPLLWVLRDVLGMTGTKFGCGQALCGACTAHVDGAATRSCITTVDSIGERDHHDRGDRPGTVGRGLAEGVALAGGGTDFSVNGLGSGRSDLFQAGAYVRYTNGPAYIAAALGRTSRPIAI